MAKSKLYLLQKMFWKEMDSGINVNTLPTKYHVMSFISRQVKLITPKRTIPCQDVNNIKSEPPEADNLEPTSFISTTKKPQPRQQK